MSALLNFLSPRKPHAPQGAPTPSADRTLWNNYEEHPRSSLGQLSSPAVHERSRSVASPAAVAAAKYATDDATDDIDEPSQSDEKTYSFHAETTETNIVFAAPSDLTLTTPQARRAQPPEATPRANADTSDYEGEDDGQFPFKRFLDHRRTGNGNEIEIQVEWESGPSTWEPEINLHRDASESLFAYWESQGGRPLNPQDPELFDIFAIRKHSKNKKRLQVEWLGYDKSEWTWLPREVVEETAKEVVEAYWKGLKAK